MINLGAAFTLVRLIHIYIYIYIWCKCIFTRLTNKAQTQREGSYIGGSKYINIYRDHTCISIYTMLQMSEAHVGKSKRKGTSWTPAFNLFPKYHDFFFFQIRQIFRISDRTSISLEMLWAKSLNCIFEVIRGEALKECMYLHHWLDDKWQENT